MLGSNVVVVVAAVAPKMRGPDGGGSGGGALCKLYLNYHPLSPRLGSPSN